MSIFNEDMRVKIPATIQLLRLGYAYQSLREADVDFNTKIFINRFKLALEKLNGREFSYDEIKEVMLEINSVIKNNDLGKEFYNWLVNPLDRVKLIDRTFWNSVVNKTPITYSTNREIGGVAPSVYLSKIESSGKVTTPELEKYVSTHWINVSSCRDDDFQAHIISRAKMILRAIENATGKTISGKDSEEVIKSFGESLA